jgi:hypothetical protein
MRRLTIFVAGVAILGACQAPAAVSLKTDTPSYHVRLDLDAASLGQRTATIAISSADGHPVAVEYVVLSPTMTGMNMTGPVVQARQLDTGQYEAKGQFFTMLGDWTVRVRIVGPGSPHEEEASFAVTAVP